MRKALLLLVLLAFFQKCTSDDFDLTAEEDDYYDDEPTEEPVETEPEEPEVQVEQPEYEAPTDVHGAHLFENFQEADHVNAHWTHSASPEFSGRFQVGTGGNNPSLDKENGIYVPREAQRYAIFGSLTNPFDFTTEKTFVVQYEVRMHEPLQCGGAYIKLASKQDNWVPSDVTNDTPYTVMFGPDKCGTTNKVHFIWKFQNPVTEEFVEHHLMNSPSPPGTSDKRSHIYTLIIRSDQTYEIFIDQESQKSGSLLTDFDPPLVPLQEIDDPEDLKPEDWVDDAVIADPEAVKPEDWNEDAPRMIADPEAEMPEGWEEDEAFEVADPDASEPEDWDEEDDGEWEAPMIDNPKCAVGCGEWQPPAIENPDYKGKWSAPMTDNPDYIGEFVPKQIANPEYFQESEPYQKLVTVAGVVIDIWTMQKGIEYDNLYVGNSEDVAYELSGQWKIRSDFQKAAMKASEPTQEGGSAFDDVMMYVAENFFPIMFAFLVIVAGSIWWCCCGSEAPEDVQARAEAEAEPEAEEEKPEEATEEAEATKDEE